MNWLLFNSQCRQDCLCSPRSTDSGATYIVSNLVKMRNLFILSLVSWVRFFRSVITFEIFLVIHRHAINRSINAMDLRRRVRIQTRWHHFLSSVFALMLVWWTTNTKPTVVMCLVHYEIMGMLRLLNWKFHLLLEGADISWNSHATWLVDSVLLQ